MLLGGGASAAAADVEAPHFVARLHAMASIFGERAGLLLPAHLASSAAVLAITCGLDGTRPLPFIHWLLPGEDPVAAALKLADALASATGAAAAAPAIAAERLEVITSTNAVAASAAALLPGLLHAVDVPAALLSSAGSIDALATAGAEQLLAWCGDANLAGALHSLFTGPAPPGPAK